MRNVSSTSLTAGDVVSPGGISGRGFGSSRTRNSSRFDSSHSAYEPSPSARVMASSASVWRSDAWRMSSRRQRDAERGDASQDVRQSSTGDQAVAGFNERGVTELQRLEQVPLA